MGFPRQDYWSELPFPSPGDLPNPGVEPALAGGFFTTGPPGKPQAHPARRKIPQQSQGFAFRSLWCVEMSTRAWAFSRGPHFPFFFKICIYLFLATLDLHYCMQALSSCGEPGFLTSCGTQFSYCSSFSCYGAQAQCLRHMGLDALRHVESSWTSG